MKWLLAVLLLFQQLALPGYRWSFPKDDGAHPAFSTEWWYFTGNLGDYGFELTFFRVRPDLYFTHFAITDLKDRRFTYHTRARRADWGQAGASPGRLWNENWTADFGPSGPTRLTAAWGAGAQAMSLDLALVPGPRMLNGVGGYSQKGSAPGEASYYYSYPHILARGRINGQSVSGLVWMDHEFSSGELAPDQVGWDWMGLHLAGRGDLMLFQLRDRNRAAGGGRAVGTVGQLGGKGREIPQGGLPPGNEVARPQRGSGWDGDPRGPHPSLSLSGARGRGPRWGPRQSIDTHSAGTWLPLGGKPLALTDSDFSLSPLAWSNPYVAAWRVRVPKLGLDFQVRPALADQELHDPVMGVAYWEGAVGLAGVPGDGYLEMTGYRARFNLLQSSH